ncbi:unnamed protein product [Sphagnum troendelagicum]
MLFGLGPPPQSRQQKHIPLLILHRIRVSERVDALLHAMHATSEPQKLADHQVIFGKLKQLMQAKAADQALNARRGPGDPPVSNANTSQYPPLHAAHSALNGGKLPASVNHPSVILQHDQTPAGTAGLPRASISSAEDHGLITGDPCHVVMWETGTEPMLTAATNSKQQGLIGVAGRDVMKKLCAA